MEATDNLILKNFHVPELKTRKNKRFSKKIAVPCFEKDSFLVLAGKQKRFHERFQKTQAILFSFRCELYYRDLN